MTLTASARTHAGRVRPQNEDAAVCRPEHGLFAVIDGMGGQEAGEVAAAIAAAALAEVPNVPRLAGETVLVEAMKEARSRILRQAAADAAHREMGAVATAVRLDDRGRSLSLAHVGDTRAWLVDAKAVRQLTHDHVGEGEGKRPVARDLGRVDMDGDWVETGRFPYKTGDLLVLASDGLHDAVPADELATELRRLWREGGDAEAVSARLVALALARGGPDNVTVVAVRLGRFRRGARRGRLGVVLTGALFVVLVGLLIASLYGRRTPPPALLPEQVPTSQVVGPHLPEIAVEAGKTTSVAAGSTLEVRGAHVTGVEWTVRLEPGARLRLGQSVVELSGAFLVTLGKGAILEVVDSRIRAGGIRVVTGPEGRVVLRHALLADPSGTPTFEGPVSPELIDVRWTETLPPPPAPVPTP